MQNDYCFVKVKLDINHDQKYVVEKEFSIPHYTVKGPAIKDVVDELIKLYNANTGETKEFCFEEVYICHNKLRFCVQVSQALFFLFRYNLLRLALSCQIHKFFYQMIIGN